MTAKVLTRAIQLAGFAAAVCVAGALVAPKACLAFGHTNSYVTTTPEPSAFALAAVVAIPFAMRLRRKK